MEALQFAILEYLAQFNYMVQRSSECSELEAAACDLFQMDELDIPNDPFQIDVL